VRKIIIYLFITLMLMSLCLISIPHVSAQKSEVKILSYNYYIDTMGILDVVGEVQNVGPNTLTEIFLTGSVYSGGIDQDDSGCTVGIQQYPVEYLAPGQKAPFYMEFYQPNNPNNPNESWFSLPSANVVLSVSHANATTSYQYPDLKVLSSAASIGTNPSGSDADLGVYWVNAVVQNTGTQTARNVTVLGTFYNSTGNVLAVGFSNSIGSLAPSATSTFKLGAFDINQTNVVESAKITSYSLLVNALSPVLQGTPPITTPYPTSGASTSPSRTSSATGSSSSSGTANNKSTSFLSSTIIAVIAVIVIFVAVGAVVAVRMHKPRETTKERLKRKRVDKKSLS